VKKLNFKSVLSDLAVLAGGAGAAYGCALYSRPLGFIVGGVLLIVGGLLAGYDRHQIGRGR
jgi:hypothetical protein